MYLNVKVASISPCEELAGLRVKALTKDMYNAGLLRCAWDRQHPWMYLHRTESLHYTLMALRVDAPLYENVSFELCKP